MPQTFMHSRFSHSFLHLQREKGFITSLHRQRRHAKILMGDGEFLPSWVVCCEKKLDFTKNNISSSRDKSRTQRSTRVQTFGATSDGEVVLQPKDDHGTTWQSTFCRKWDAFVTFSRPYTIICTSIGVCSVSLLPLTSVGDFSPAYFVGLIQALIAFICGNIYTSGINQLVDSDMDKINKPYLPLVSGELSVGEVRAIVTALTFMCLAIGIMFQSAPLFIGLLSFFLIGTAYSVELPFLRWKTKPAMAIFSMAGMSGLTYQPGVFYHIQNALGKPMVLSRSAAFTTIFFSIFGAVLGLIKDIPDVEGDKACGNQTFCVRYGKEKVFSLSLNILLIAYGSAVALGASSSLLICKIVSVIGHTTLASLLMLRANSINLEDPVSTQSFYMFLFKLLYAEYALIQFMR
ncbi:umbelliferone 6-dimethylallyltransferase, chloroplastic-like [Apium graveolens]|uniref:umbelliferone 6-dimethylallyltransferase, chloroplastic-like n=1 Tax=Apium graveolens TaxID=4045 RepID=UPI003D7B5E54